MESNKNNDNNGGDQYQHQQLQGSARKRTFNELANDVGQPSDEDQQEPENCSKKNRVNQVPLFGGIFPGQAPIRALEHTEHQNERGGAILLQHTLYKMNMKMMEETRIMGVSYGHDILHATQIDLYCRWLYQTASSDGKPRMLQFGVMNVNSAPVSLFIDRIKQDFLLATDPVTFFIRINLPKAFQPKKDICLENDKTNERLLTKIEEAEVQEEEWEEVVLLISRYSHASTKKWIVEKEKEVLAWDIRRYNERTIHLRKEMKVVAI